MASPLAAGLFRGAIGESTSVMDSSLGIAGRRTLADAEAQGTALAATLKAPSLEALRASSVADLVKAGGAFWPIEKDGYVLPDGVYETFAKGRQNKVRLLVGSNANEVATLPMVWVKPQTDQEKAAYDGLYAGPGDKQLTNDTVAWQMRVWAALHTRTSGQPAFLYWFDHSWPGADGKPDPRGAFHASEIPYVFGNLDTAKLPWTDADRRLSELMSSYWVNFAKAGDPNGDGLPPWPAYQAQGEPVMELSDQPHARPIPRQGAMEFIEAYFARRRAP